jgi:hypothetical protein
MRQGEAHRHLAHGHAGFDAGGMSGFSLMRLSVPARLIIVALAAALLWTAVLWALR